MTMGMKKTDAYYHSGMQRNPGQTHNWTPACAGVTEVYVVIARFIRVIQRGLTSLLDYRNTSGNDTGRHSGENRNPARSHNWIPAYAGMTPVRVKGGVL